MTDVHVINIISYTYTAADVVKMVTPIRSTDCVPVLTNQKVQWSGLQLLSNDSFWTQNLETTSAHDTIAGVPFRWVFDLLCFGLTLQDVDDIHEYLLLKGVDAVSIHGGKEQEERNEAIKLFKVRCARRVVWQ